MPRRRVNTSLLRLTLKTIEENPEHWNQGLYACGTKYCFAGTAVLLSRGLPVGIHAKDFYANYPSIQTGPEAERVLGLSWEQASMLFYSGSTLDELRRYVAELYANTEYKENFDAE